ncbi:hypothetical protein SAMN05216483_4107 [Streptomyces sp. 2131.1]|uniref:LppX_LprAFG lipoprotein n=1 Tax=Streptomyces sp. 2131.1 TaxID=1855346 RepID=UPI000896FE6F|nr:LppX_LprAFG lipoprotein [Streptomyces sp. 2131.1]SED58197.1 hypothetical protein SAMN05216483_4107 [Streptomyces sp. 2131.1]
MANVKSRGAKASAYGLAGLLAVAALAGCGSDDKGDSGAAGKPSGTAAKPSDAAGKSPSQVVQAANKNTTAAGSAKVKITTSVSAKGQSRTVTGSGVMDFEDGESKLTMEQAGQRLEQRVVDEVIYQKPPKGQGGLPGGKSWMRIDIEKLRTSGAAGNSQVSDPTDSFAYSKAVSEKDVKKVGTENLGGVETTHYKVGLDIDKLAKGDAAQAKKLREQLGETVPMDLWIDGKGLTRRQQIEMTAQPTGGAKDSGSANQGKAKVVMDFSDFGTDVDVDAPAAGDTVDVTDKVVKQAGQQKQQS